MLAIFSILLLFSCNEYPPNWSDGNTDGIVIDGLSEIEKLNNALLLEAVPLSDNPLEWTDEQLNILDVLADKKIVGLGEATHGTSEFFSAKYRIFRYLVENHGYKVIVMEADFGESILINEAVWEGRTEDINALMKEHMYFWTWKNEEVQNLLEWMCDYNRGRPEQDRVVYMGNDCQINDKNLFLLSSYLKRTKADLNEIFFSTMNKLNTAQNINYADYTDDDFIKLLSEIDEIKSIYNENEAALIELSDAKEYQLYDEILNIVKQVVNKVYYMKKRPGYHLYRDQYMAENVAWIYNYYNEEKMVVWAHNGHVADDQLFTNGSDGSMGNFLKYSFLSNYAQIGFSLSKGSFIARSTQGPLTIFELKALEPNSLNDAFSRTNKTFFIDLEKLNNSSEWNQFFKSQLSYLSIGSTYSDRWISSMYHGVFLNSYFDYMIHFNITTAAKYIGN